MNSTHLLTKVTSLDPYEVGKRRHRESQVLPAGGLSEHLFPLRSVQGRVACQTATLSNLCCPNPVALTTLPCMLRFTAQEFMPGAELSVSKLVLATYQHTEADTHKCGARDSFADILSTVERH